MPFTAFRTVEDHPRQKVFREILIAEDEEPDEGAIGGIRGQERRLRVAVLEELHDHRRLGQRPPVFLLDDGHAAARVLPVEPRGPVGQVDLDRLPSLLSLQQQGLVQKTVDELTLEERTIIKLRFGVLQDDELTLRDIGEILGLSRERVRQIESRAEAKCRRSVRRNRERGAAR